MYPAAVNIMVVYFAVSIMLAAGAASVRATAVLDGRGMHVHIRAACSSGKRIDAALCLPHPHVHCRLHSMEVPLAGRRQM